MNRRPNVPCTVRVLAEKYSKADFVEAAYYLARHCGRSAAVDVLEVALKQLRAERKATMNKPTVKAV